jgi:hypothetical protein
MNGQIYIKNSLQQQLKYGGYIYIYNMGKLGWAMKPGG